MQAYDVVAPAVKSAAETAAPYVKSAVSKVGEVAGPALQQAEPTIKARPVRTVLRPIFLGCPL